MAAAAYSAHVEAMELLAPEVMRLQLVVTDGRQRAVQGWSVRINILLDDGQRRVLVRESATTLNDRAARPPHPWWSLHRPCGLTR